MRPLIALVFVSGLLTSAAGRDDPPPPAPPVKLSAQEDHKRMLGLLGIEKLRPGPSGDQKRPNAANNVESKVAPYALPDPLTFTGGAKVKADDWRWRRAEIMEVFDREVYGRVPKDMPKVTWTVTDTEKQTIGDVPAVVKRLVGHVDNAAYPAVTVDIQMTLVLPEKATGPVPVVLEFGFVFPAGKGPKAPAKGPPKGFGPDWRGLVLAKGWGAAVIAPNSVQADNGGGLTQGIIGLCNKGQPRKPEDWGALRAWAWGASRALDYFETDTAVDAKKVAIEGLSRYGKAAAVTMAYDERFALACIGSSGAGGLKIARRNFGEQVENVAGTGEYHWMAGNYLKYAGPLTPAHLPVDAHELVALMAPRPVFISVGTEVQDGNGWIDCKGNFLAGVGAGPVYELLGKKSLGTAEFPPQGTGLVDGDIAFRQHEGGHTVGPNWPYFLTYAERYFKR